MAELVPASTDIYLIVCIGGCITMISIYRMLYTFANAPTGTFDRVVIPHVDSLLMGELEATEHVIRKTRIRRRT